MIYINGKRLLHGIILMFIGWLFCYSETKYFGSNLWAGSNAEWVCDTISSILVLIGEFLIVTSHIKRKNHDSNN